MKIPFLQPSKQKLESLSKFQVLLHDFTYLQFFILKNRFDVILCYFQSLKIYFVCRYHHNKEMLCQVRSELTRVLKDVKMMSF